MAGLGRYYWWLGMALGLMTGLAAMAAYRLIPPPVPMEPWRNATLILNGPVFGALLAWCLRAAGVADGRRAGLFALAIGAASILALASFFPLMWMGRVLERATDIRWWHEELWTPTFVAAVMGLIFGLLAWAAAAAVFDCVRRVRVAVPAVLSCALSASLYGWLEGAFRPLGFLEFVQLDVVLLVAGLTYAALAATLGRVLFAEGNQLQHPV